MKLDKTKIITDVANVFALINIPEIDNGNIFFEDIGTYSKIEELEIKKEVIKYGYLSEGDEDTIIYDTGKTIFGKEYFDKSKEIMNALGYGTGFDIYECENKDCPILLIPSGYFSDVGVLIAPRDRKRLAELTECKFFDYVEGSEKKTTTEGRK